MGNLGGLEVVVIFLVALIVLGPSKLPDAAKQVGKAVNEMRRISGGFQREMREAFQDPVAEEKARERGRSITADQRAARASGKNPHAKADEQAVDETLDQHQEDQKPSAKGAEPAETDETDETDPYEPADDESV